MGQYRDEYWWNPMSTLTAADGQVQLKGPSGYIAPNDTHMETGHMGSNENIYNDAGDLYTDAWPMPTGWRKILSN